MSCSLCRAVDEGIPAAGLGSRRKIFRTYPKDQVWAGSPENAGSAWMRWVMRANLLYNPDNPLTASVTNNRETFPNSLRLQYPILASIIRPVSFLSSFRVRRLTEIFRISRPSNNGFIAVQGAYALSMPPKVREATQNVSTVPISRGCPLTITQSQRRRTSQPLLQTRPESQNGPCGHKQMRNCFFSATGGTPDPPSITPCVKRMSQYPLADSGKQSTRMFSSCKIQYCM